MINYPAPDITLLSGSIAIATSTLAFLLYLFVVSPHKFNVRLNARHIANTAAIWVVLYQRLLGAILFGLVPILIIVFVFQRPLIHFGFSGEFLFRGFKLFAWLENFGYWPAIIINISLYSFFHIHKGDREAIGSLFYGFLLCYLTLHLGSFWFAFFIHVTIALANEWFSLGFQPEMKLVKSGRNQ